MSSTPRSGVAPIHRPLPSDTTSSRACQLNPASSPKKSTKTCGYDVSSMRVILTPPPRSRRKLPGVAGPSTLTGEVLPELVGSINAGTGASARVGRRRPTLNRPATHPSTKPDATATPKKPNKNSLVLSPLSKPALTALSKPRDCC